MSYCSLTICPTMKILEGLNICIVRGDFVIETEKDGSIILNLRYLQLPSLQFPFSDLSFGETLSQYAVQVRLLDLFPSPHVALQVDQVPHAENSAGPYINFEYFSTIMK